MATMKDRLTPTPKPVQNRPDGSQSTAMQFNMPAPKVTMNPSFDVAAPNVDVKNDVDTAPIASEIAKAMSAMTSVVQEFMGKHAEVMAAIAKQNELLERLADKEQKAPVVKTPPRPNGFTVALEKDGGQTVGMRIVADKPH